MDTEERWFKLERAGLVRLVCTPDPHHSYPCVPGGCPHRVVVNGFRFVVDVEGWAESVQFDAGDIAARWRDIVTCLRTVAVDSPPEDVRGDRDKIDRAIADLRDSNLARMALPALYLSTGRYMPDEAKRAREVLSGFCDAAGKPTPKADATHVGWSLVA